MDITWQYNNPANPADAAIGPQAYDTHLYYSYVHFCCVILIQRSELESRQIWGM